MRVHSFVRMFVPLCFNFQSVLTNTISSTVRMFIHILCCRNILNFMKLLAMENKNDCILKITKYSKHDALSPLNTYIYMNRICST
jgi:hypothetical protein